MSIQLNLNRATLGLFGLTQASPETRLVVKPENRERRVRSTLQVIYNMNASHLHLKLLPIPRQGRNPG
jgi:hypothetical protein